MHRLVAPAILTTLAALALACGGGLSSDEVGAAMQPYCEVGDAGTAVALATVPGASGELTRRVRVELTDEGTRLDWELVAFGDLTDRIVERLDLVDTIARRSSEEPGRVVQLAIDGGISAQQVVATVEAVRAAHPSGVEFLVATDQRWELPEYLDPTYGADLEGRIRDVSPEMRAVTLAQEIDGLISLCPGAQQTFEAVAYASTDMKCTLITAGLAESLPSCPMTDGAQVVTAAQVASRPHGEFRPAVFAVTLDPEGAAVPATGTWADIAPKLAAKADQAVWLTP